MAFIIRQNDTSPALSTRLTDNKVPVDISGFEEVSFHVEDEQERVVISDDTTGNVTVTNPSLGDVEYSFDAEDTKSAGTFYAEWEVDYGNDDFETFPSQGDIVIEIVEEIG